ncbi:MAG: aminotransferase class I/II-fold pyridoxal phosphate-dependent enzyme [Lachnospiraceae bacterium]|nr:aminotransferase class I/II-fold pyridoxal phosphate-dependent enzyme [Lachnospiraceae bacterium]
MLWGKMSQKPELMQALSDYKAQGLYPYHMPGHKGRGFGSFPETLAMLDLTEVEGTGDLYSDEGIIADAQERAARLMGVSETHFLVGGSSAGVMAAISACIRCGGSVIMDRGAHRSAINALYVQDADPVWVRRNPVAGGPAGLTEAISAAEVSEALRCADAEGKDPKAVFITSPTYEGYIADIESIADICHGMGIPLIVDEAHGAHFGWLGTKVKSATQLGADISIRSLHKTLPAPTQTAVICIEGDIVNRDRLKGFLRMYQSSSPSYLLMSAIDNCFDVMEEQGEELFVGYDKRLKSFYRETEGLEHIAVLGPSDGSRDPGKVIIYDISADPLTGTEIAQILREELKAETEMATPGYVLAMMTICDTDYGFDHLTDAIKTIDRDYDGFRSKYKTGRGTVIPRNLPGIPRRACSIREAMDAESACEVLGGEISDAGSSQRLGGAQHDDRTQVASEMIGIYPPGNAIVLPGEMIDEQAAEYIRSCYAAGILPQGVHRSPDDENTLLINAIRF